MTTFKRIFIFNPDILQTVVKNIIRIRKEKNITQEQLALDIDMSYDYYRHFEAGLGKNGIKVTNLYKIAVVLGVDIGVFLLKRNKVLLKDFFNQSKFVNLLRLSEVRMKKISSALYYFACVCGVIIALFVLFAINLWPVFHKYHSIGYSDIYELSIHNFIPDIKLDNYQKFLKQSESVISTNIKTFKKHLKTVPYGVLIVTIPWVNLEKTENILSEWNITYDSNIKEYVINNQDSYTETIEVTENSDLQYSLRINLSSFTWNKNKNNSKLVLIFKNHNAIIKAN